MKISNQFIQTEESTNILETKLIFSFRKLKHKYLSHVNDIIENVRAKKDAAIFEYTKKFDGADINADNILVTEEEIAEAYEQVDPKLLDVIRKAMGNIPFGHVVPMGIFF